MYDQDGLSYPFLCVHWPSSVCYSPLTWQALSERPPDMQLAVRII